ncbi:16509_t:CDS:2, partial [Acaulospora morrowiae]
MSLPIYIYFERMGAYVLYTVRSYDVNLGNCRYMIVRLDNQDGILLFSGVFMGYASGRNLNSSGLVESPTSFASPSINGIFREENNGELILVGYITRKNYQLLYRFSCLECDMLFSYSSFLNIHSRVHTRDRPYGCTFSECNSSFTTNGNRIRHERRFHR